MTTATRLNPATDPPPMNDVCRSAKGKARGELIERLQGKIHRIETSRRVDDGNIIRSGCATLDQVLPDGGYRRGSLVEWIIESQRTDASVSGGYGADFLSLLTAHQACRDGGALVIADSLQQFYPPAAAAMGINLSNLIVLRATGHTNEEDLYWAIDQSLRCPAVAAVWCAIEHIHERWFRRFQLAAESSGTLGLFVRPPRAAQQPSWAEVQWRVAPLGAPLGAPIRNRSITTPLERGPRARGGSSARGGSNSGARPRHRATSHLRCCQLQLHRCHGGRTGQLIHVEIDPITGSVRGRQTGPYRQRSEHETMPLSVAAQLAHPAVGCRKETA